MAYKEKKLSKSDAKALSKALTSANDNVTRKKKATTRRKKK